MVFPLLVRGNTINLLYREADIDKQSQTHFQRSTGNFMAEETVHSVDYSFAGGCVAAINGDGTKAIGMNSVGIEHIFHYRTSLEGLDELLSRDARLQALTIFRLLHFLAFKVFAAVCTYHPPPRCAF